MSQGPGVVEVFTDGSYTGQRGRGRGGLGVWWGRNDSWNLSERCPDSVEGSSLLSELHAFRRLLEQLVDPRNTPSVGRIDKLLVGIDCENVLKLFTFNRRRFRKTGFVKKDGRPITHVNIVRYITALLEDAERLIEIELYHIGGHNGSEGNEGADFLAKQGAARSWAPPEQDWNMLERRVRRKLADLKAEEEAWAEKKRKNVEELSLSRKKPRQETIVATQRNPLPLLHPTPAVSTNVAFSGSTSSRKAASLAGHGSDSDSSDDDEGTSDNPIDISDDEAEELPASDNSSLEMPEASSPESSQTSSASTSSTLCSTDSDLRASLSQSTGSQRLKDIQAGLDRKAAARERRRLEIEAALANARKTVPVLEQMALQVKLYRSSLKAQTSTSSAARSMEQNTKPTSMAVVRDEETTPATNANVVATQDLGPTHFVKKNVPTSSLPSVYTQEELVTLASFVDSDDLAVSDVESNGLGSEKASQKSSSSSVYTPEELSALADFCDDVVSDMPGPTKILQKIKYTEEELEEMAAWSDFELDD